MEHYKWANINAPLSCGDFIHHTVLLGCFDQALTRQPHTIDSVVDHILLSFFLVSSLEPVTVIFRVFLSAIVCPRLNLGLPPRCPQVVWCH